MQLHRLLEVWRSLVRWREAMLVTSQSFREMSARCLHPLRGGRARRFPADITQPAHHISRGSRDSNVVMAGHSRSKNAVASVAYDPAIHRPRKRTIKRKA